MKNQLDEFLAAYQGDISYDFDNNILLNWYPKRIVAQERDKKLSLLELGLGHGYSTSIFSEYFEDHTVLDGSAAVIDHFKSKYPDCKATIVETYFEDFKTEEQYDIIVMGFVLEHVDDPVQILEYYRQYLKDDGVLYAAVPNAEVMNRRLGLITGILPTIDTLSENDHLLGHQRYYTMDAFESDIKKAGYSIEKTEGIYLKPLSSAQMQSLDLSEEIINAFCELGVSYPELSCGIMVKARK